MNHGKFAHAVKKEMERRKGLDLIDSIPDYVIQDLADKEFEKRSNLEGKKLQNKYRFGFTDGYRKALKMFVEQAGKDLSSSDGNPKHYHALQRDGDRVSGHGPANVGEKHKHPIEDNRLGPADTDGHTHTF